mmetsp:Transcript_71340/g.222552  ORF Transcript_71340/g.222552 Transcript_71340/m.222552 type:complete len:399 (+) Transcript_71340:120-1316(+)
MEVQVEAKAVLVLVRALAGPLGGEDGGVPLQRGLAIDPVEVLPQCVHPLVAELYAVRVEHRHNEEDIPPHQLLCNVRGRDQEVQQALQHVAGRRLCGVHAGGDEDRLALLEQARPRPLLPKVEQRWQPISGLAPHPGERHKLDRPPAQAIRENLPVHVITSHLKVLNKAFQVLSHGKQGEGERVGKVQVLFLGLSFRHPVLEGQGVTVAHRGNVGNGFDEPPRVERRPLAERRGVHHRPQANRALLNFLHPVVQDLEVQDLKLQQLATGEGAAHSEVEPLALILLLGVALKGLRVGGGPHVEAVFPRWAGGRLHYTRTVAGVEICGERVVGDLPRSPTAFPGPDRRLLQFLLLGAVAPLQGGIAAALVFCLQLLCLLCMCLSFLRRLSLLWRQLLGLL